MAIIDAAGPPPGINSDTGYTPRRAYVLSGTGPTFVAPAAGGAIDGVSGLGTGTGAPTSPRVPGSTTTEGYCACRGVPVLVEAAAAFGVGANLVVTSDGRAQTGSGTVVLRALQASSGAGAIVAAVFV